MDPAPYSPPFHEHPFYFDVLKTIYLPLASEAVVGVMAAVDIPFGAARAVTACGTCARVTGAR